MATSQKTIAAQLETIYLQRTNKPLPTLRQIKLALKANGNSFFSRENTKFFSTRKYTKKGYLVTCHNTFGNNIRPVHYFFTHKNDLAIAIPKSENQPFAICKVEHDGIIFNLTINLKTGHFTSIQRNGEK